MEMLKMNNNNNKTAPLMKNGFSRHLSRINTARERISELEDRLIEITQTGKQEGKKNREKVKERANNLRAVEQ